MKRLLLGVAAVAAVLGTSAPVSADVVGYEVQRCYATVFYPCGVCVTVGAVTECTRG